jgi:cell division transport system permease protein
VRSIVALARYVLSAAVRGLRGSAGAAAMAVVTIALVLVLAGAFGVVIANMQALVERVGDELSLSAFLDPLVDDPGRAALASQAAKIDGVLAVAAVSPAEALARFPERTGVSASAVALLDANPLPASLELRLRPESRDPAAVERVREALRALPGVVEVSAGDDLVAGYARAVGLVSGVGLAVGLVLALATVVIVASTIRLALQARRDELEILALVGASRSTMRLPFLLEGFAQGACGGVLALGLLWALFTLAHPAVQAALVFLAGPDSLRFLSGLEMVSLVASGGLLGLLGAAFSLAEQARA